MAKGSGPIQYNELFNNDVDARLAQLSTIVTELNTDFQGLAATIGTMSGKITAKLNSANASLERMATDMQAVDVAARGAGDRLHGYSRELETTAARSRNLRDQQAGLNAAFNSATASVDQIKAQVKLLTAEYNALGRATDADKAKAAALATQVVALRNQQEALTSALNRTRTAIVAADGSYNQMSQRLASLKKELFAMPNAFNPATGALNRANTAAMALHRQITQLDTALKKADASMGMHGRNVGNYSGALGGALDQLKSLALGYLSVQGALMAVQSTFSTALQQDATRVSLEFTLKSTDLANAKMQELADMANRLGVDFNALTKTYASFAGAATAANMPLAETNKIFNSVTGAAARFHLTAEQLSGSLLAIQQMISKGTVQAEELRGQLSERLPGAFSIAARAMGVTEKKLGDMLKAGEVLASDLLPKLAIELDKTFSLDKNTKIDSLTASWERFTNTFSESVNDNSNITGFFKGIVDGLGMVSSTLLKTINSSSWKEFGDRMKGIAGLMRGDIGVFAVNSAMADATKQKRDPVGAAIKDFSGKGQKEQIEDIKTLTIIRNRAYEQAKLGNTDDIKFYNQQQRILVALTQAYKNLYSTKKEVATVDKETDAERKKREAAEKAAETARIAAAKKAIQDADDLLKAQTKLNIAALEQKEIAELAGKTEEQQTAIVIQFEKDKLKIIEDGIAAREKLYKKGTVAYIELEVEKANATTDAQEKIAKATEDGLKRQQALQEKYRKLREDLLGSQNQGAQAAAEFGITSKVYKGTEQEQETQKQAALYQLRRDALMRELSLVELRNASIKDSVERELVIKKEKQDVLNQLDQLGYDNFTRLQDEQKAKLEEMFSYLRQNNSIIGELYGQEFGNLFDSLTNNLQNLLDKTGNGIADWAETIKAGVATASSIFKQGSEERIAALETEKQQQMDIAGANTTARLNIEKAFNDRIRAEKRKQAKIDKAAAIFEIAINTAVAASKVTAQTGLFGLPLVPIIIAFGAIQAGLVAARPLPEFRKGTQNAPEGFARVGEDGAELIESRRGNMRIAHNDQVTYLERGDKVYTAAQTRKILDTTAIDSNTELHGRLATNLHNQSSERRIREMSIAFRQDPEAIGEAVGRRIKSLPIHETHFDERGVSRFIRENGTRTKYLNDRTSLK